MDDPALVVLCTSVREAEANEWALVLMSAGVACRVARGEAEWTLFVGVADTEVARLTLAAYDEDRRAVIPLRRAAPEYGPTRLGPALAALMLGFFAVTGPWSESSQWHARGSAWASRILDGEVWRLVTALTLHADLVHALGNAVACIVFVSAIARWLGPGVGAAAFLLAGVFGNALTALVHQEAHISVGASTAVFGASGVLVALQVMAWRRGHSVTHKPWVMIGATLALFAMLGVGSRADVFAHAFGMLTGALLGAVCAQAFRRPLPRVVQGTLLFMASLVVLASWHAALP